MKKKGKLIYKLSWMLMLSICVPVILFSYISYTIAYRSMEIQYKDNKSNLNRQIVDKIEDNFYALRSQSTAFFDYESIANLLTTNQSEITDEYIDNYNRVYSNLVSIIQGNFKIDGISLSNLEGEIKFYYNRNMSQQNLNRVCDEQWYIDTIKAAGRPVLLAPHYNSYAKEEEKVASVCRALLDPYDDKIVGVIKIDQNLSTFLRCFESLDMDNGELQMVLDSKGDVFYSSANIPLEEAKKLSGISTEHGRQLEKWEYDNQKYIVIDEHSKDNKWKFISFTPEENMKEQARFIRIINTWTGFILAGICILIAIVISLIINRPIKVMNDSMLKFQNGNMDVQIDVKSNDEFGMMAEVFNSMVKNIRKLINEKYELNLLKKEAQLENFQSQINPHFLFNTLNSIKAVSMQGNQEKTTKMIQYFSENFRYSLNKGVYTVTFNDELEYINKYITLQMIRFGDKISVEKNIEEDVLDNECIRMILQPIVENAFYHGLEKTTEKGKILIVAQNVSDDFHIYISNTGAIVPEYKMKEINSALSVDEERYGISNADKVGIYNVNARIKFHYGKKYGLKMIYGLDKETTIRIVLPCIKKEKKDESINC